MEYLEYEYKIIRHKGDETTFLVEVNQLARKGWRVIHYASEGMVSTALLELAKPAKESHKA